MKCIKFVDLIPYYLDNDIDLNTKEEMNEHIKNCKNCDEQLNIRRELIASFKYVLEGEDLKFKSRKEEIMKNINGSKYSPNVLKKMFYHLNKHKTIYSGTLVASFLMVIIFNLGGNLFSNLNGYNTSMESSSSSDATQDTTTTMPQNNTEKGLQTDTPQYDLTGALIVTVKYDVLPKTQLNPTGTGISSMVTPEYENTLTNTLKKMRELESGVGPWKTIYYNNNKLMFYNYNHVIAYNTNQNGKGIYSIIDLNNLKVGGYQGDEIIEFSFSPDGNYCLIGTYDGAADMKPTNSLYMCNINDGTIKEIGTNFCMLKKNTVWYSTPPGSSKWIVTAKDRDTSNTVLWDVGNSKALGVLPTNIKEVKDDTGKFLFNDNLNFKDDTGNIFKLDTKKLAESWWFKDSNTLIGVPYRNDIQRLKLLDFEIVEININDKTGKVVFRP